MCNSVADISEKTFRQLRLITSILHKNDGFTTHTWRWWREENKSLRRGSDSFRNVKTLQSIDKVLTDMEANGVDIATAIYNLTIKIH